MEMERTTMSRLWDKIGICASGLCMVHCLTTPILLIFYPLFIHTEMHELVHELLAFIVVASIMIAVFPKCHKHGHYDIIMIALIGLFLVVGGLFLHETSILFATIATSFGSAFLIYAHYRNMRVRHGKCQSTKTSCGNH